MKILIVSQYFWPENFSINAIAKYLHEQGHTVDILTGIPNYPQGKAYDGYGLLKKLHQNYDGIDIHRVWMKTRGQKGGDKRLILNYITYALDASVVMLTKLRKKYDATFVYAMSPITHAYPAIFLRKLKKVPMCLYVGDLWPDTLFSHGIGSKKVKTIITNACANIYKKSDCIIVTNESFYEPIKNYTKGTRKITYIPQAVEDIYKPLEGSNKLRKTLGIDDNDFVVMFAGNIGFAQSPKTIVEAAKITKLETRIHYVFVGDGTLKKECEEFCCENDLSNVHFIGRKPQDEMPSLIAQADAMLITLKDQSNYNLTLPGRTQAFMACGKPIICCANGETARVIRESKSGFTAQAENPSALSDIVIKCAKTDINELRKIGENGLLYSKEHYDRTSVFSKIESVLKEMKYEK